MLFCFIDVRIANHRVLKLLAGFSRLEIILKFDPEAKDVAMDSTGLETTSASAHFQTRSGRKPKKFIKLSACFLAGSLIPR